MSKVVKLQPDQTKAAVVESHDGIKAQEEPPPLRVVHGPCESPRTAVARTMAGPHVANASALVAWGKTACQSKLDDLMSYIEALRLSGEAVNKGDLKDAEATLASQATLLNVMFADLARRAAQNVNGGFEYKVAAEFYFKMALKAQNQCRMTLETLANVKNPPVVYAKQANISNGPQQVNNNANVPHAHVPEQKVSPSKILEQGIEQRMDTGTPGKATRGYPALATVDQDHGT